MRPTPFPVVVFLEFLQTYSLSNTSYNLTQSLGHPHTIWNFHNDRSWNPGHCHHFPYSSPWLLQLTLYFLLKSMHSKMSITKRILKPVVGHYSPTFYYFLYLMHSITKHTNTTKETTKKKTRLLHGNCYLSEFLGHPPSMVLKLPTNHPHATWCIFPSKN